MAMSYNFGTPCSISADEQARGIVCTSSLTQSINYMYMYVYTYKYGLVNP